MSKTCFWETGCANRDRCKTSGLCIAAAQNAIYKNSKYKKALADANETIVRQKALLERCKPLLLATLKLLDPDWVNADAKTLLKELEKQDA